jgi:hypothetical protein
MSFTSAIVLRTSSLQPQASSLRAQEGRGNCAPRPLREQIVALTRTRLCAAAPKELGVFLIYALQHAFAARAVTFAAQRAAIAAGTPSSHRNRWAFQFLS